MAKKEKNTPQKNPIGFKTRGNNSTGARAATYTAPPAAEKRSPISKKKVAILSAVAAILVIAIGLGIFFGFFYNKKFNYAKEDLSKYITLSESDYKNIKIAIPLYEYSSSLVDRAITDLLVKNKLDASYDGTGVKNLPITIGDVVTLRFRGYTKDENGNEVDIASLLNLATDNDETIEVGAYDNLVGINEALLGIIPDDIPTFEKITEGVVEEGDVVYLSYSVSMPVGDGETIKNKRIDLSRTDLDEVFGVGFKDAIIGLEIGKAQSMLTLPLKNGDGTAVYVDLKAEFATKCEKNPLKLTATYPANYESDKSLRGKTVYFDFYIKNCIVHDTPEYNEEFITKTLKLTEESLKEFEGNTLIEKHRASLEKELKENIENANNQLILEAIWEHLADKGTVIKYPKSEVDGYYNSLLANVNAYYQQNTGKFESLDAAAISAYGLEAGSDWRAYLKLLAEVEVRDKLIFYYIFNNEGYKPTDEEYKETYDAIVEYELSLMIEEHKSELEGLTEEEYNEQVEFLKKELLDYLGDDGMREIIYYEIGNKKMVENLAILEKPE